MGNELVKGVKELNDSLDEMTALIDKATLSALKASQSAAKKAIKSGMRGRPRWDHRGAIGRDKTVPAVSLNLSPHHVTKGGGPGRLTGHLTNAVGGMRRPKRTGRSQFTGGVGAGGRLSITNRYRKEIERDYPYVKPGVKKAEPAIGEAFTKAWAKATET